MKRAGNLIVQIADPENLRLAYWKAQRGKSRKKEVLEFAGNLDQNLIQIREGILSGKIEIGNYHYFTIFDPKQRRICAASFPERVLHHAIMNVCHQYFEKYQIFDSYASRKEKGTYKALERAQYFHKRNQWYLKLDVRKYFDSIDHEKMMLILERLFKDNNLLELFRRIINSYSVNPLKGLPIGNLTSQYFANHYLAVADHFIKEKLRVKAYVRYMDDMVLWHEDKEMLKGFLQEVQNFLLNKLMLELKPETLNKTAKGLPFLGYRVFSDHLRLSGRSKKRHGKKLEKYFTLFDQGYFTQKEFRDHLLPMVAFTKHAKAYHFRKLKLENINGQWPWALTA